MDALVRALAQDAPFCARCLSLLKRLMPPVFYDPINSSKIKRFSPARSNFGT